MGYKIIAQGFLDGACYLYSIINAYKALVFPDMDIEAFYDMEHKNESGLRKWETLIRVSSGTTEMLAGVGFFYYFTRFKNTNAFSAFEAQCNHFTRLAFALLADDDHQFTVSGLDLTACHTADFRNSVVILPVIKKIPSLAGNEIDNHWICITGRGADTFQIACSYSIHCLPGGQYFERLDAQANRYYNNLIRVGDINESTLDKAVNCIFMITKN